LEYYVAVTYRIDPEERIVYMTTTGVTSLAEWRAAVQSILDDPAFRSGYNFLSDRREQTGVADTTFTRAAADFLKRLSETTGPFKWAAVSSSNAVYGMTRMLSMIADGAGVTARSFRDYEEARLWLLGVEELEARRT
jgi:hypothetical protein